VLKTIVERFVKWAFAYLLEAEYFRGRREHILNQEREKNAYLAIAVEEDIGKKVIYCSNEWEDPLFAIITEKKYLGNNLQLFAGGINVLTNEEIILFTGSYYYADEKLVDCILKLNPFERWNMSARYRGYNLWSKAYPNGELTDPVVLKQKLKDVNFI
jgi:hypothetical protein